ncbi:hypothetical protein BKA70DRAFT_1234458 [Coprinopsis sp. MPI-PUGE-AT-0042]|nr:hypothetical protein BKA70DRAFT_1234458 [Coprinopsis sp. MPI-PUGE-AT-0042]
MGGFLSKIPSHPVPAGGVESRATSESFGEVGDICDAIALEMQERLIRHQTLTPQGHYLLSVNKMLRNFGLPPTQTMEVVRKCRGYMSGSGVIAGLPNIPKERRFPPKDLDVFIPLKYSETFKSFLLQESGERHLCREVDLLVPSKKDSDSEEETSDPEEADSDSSNCEGTYSDNDSSYGHGSPAGRKLRSCIAKIWYFRDNRGREINVIVSSTRSALVPIVAFHSTPVMNFIAYFGIVSLYGNLTSRGVGWINRYPKSADGKHLWYHKKDSIWLEKYQQRGYTLWTGSDIPEVSPEGHRCGVDEVCTLTVRNLFDNGVVVERFQQYQSEDPVTLLRTLEPSFVWRLRNRNCKANSTSILKAGL